MLSPILGMPWYGWDIAKVGVEHQSINQPILGMIIVYFPTNKGCFCICLTQYIYMIHVYSQIYFW